MKTCVTCHLEKQLDDFAVRRAAADGRQSRCRQCFRDWYEANTPAARAAIDRRRALSRQQIRDRIAQHLVNNPCIDCGETDLRVLDFDHRVGVTKRSGVAQMTSGGWNWESVAAEIAKCDVRCANCHRRKTAERAGQWRHAWFLAHRGGLEASCEA